jgi:hypothetical protein
LNYYDTDDLTDVIQEVINREGWDSGNDMLILFRLENEDQTNNLKMASWDYYNSDPTSCPNRPELYVEWEYEELPTIEVIIDDAEVDYGPLNYVAGSILVEWTANEVMYRFGDRRYKLTHQWQPYIQTFKFNLKMEKDYGGYIKPSVSSIDLAPNAFGDAGYPPPITASYSIYFTQTTEEEKVFLLSGEAYLLRYTNEKFTYRLFIEPYNLKVLEGANYQGYTIEKVFDEVGDAMGLLVNCDRADNDVQVNYTTTDEESAVDFLSKVAASNHHCFWIDNDYGVIYLADLLYANEFIRTKGIIKDQVLPMSYSAFDPVKSLKCDSTGNGDIIVDGSHIAYGKEISVDMYDNSDSRNMGRLQNIKTILEKRKIEFQGVFGASMPELCAKWQLVDDTFWGNNSVVSTFTIRNINFDFVSRKMVISGEGEQE